MRRVALHLVASAAAFLLAVGGARLLPAAPLAGGWAPAQRVPGFAADAEPPYLIADQNHTVHAFTSQVAEDRLAVVYSQWTLAGGWTKPVDILVAPEGEARVSGVYLDPKGTMHLAFYGGNDLSFGLYYSRAPAAIADRASSWSPPVLVGEGAGPLSYGALAGDDQGNLYVVYSGRGGGMGLYAVRSDDWGATWSKPTMVFSTQSVRHSAAYVQAQVDSQGQLHAVWTVVNEGGNGDAVYYARLEEDHVTWSTPVLLAAKTEYSADRAVLIEHGSELLVTYANGNPPAHWMRRSDDGGRSWSSPVLIVEGWIGGNGPAFLLHDSSNKLHMFFGARVTNGLGPNKDLHGMWHSIWDGSRWSQPEPVVSGPPVTAAEGEQFGPWSPQAVASQGNVLLVTWVTDPGAGRNGVWYSYMVLNAPELPVVALPSPAVPTRTVSSTATPPASSLSVPTSTRSPLSTPRTQGADSTAALTDNSAQRWTLSIVPVVLLISVIVVAKTFFSKGR